MIQKHFIQVGVTALRTADGRHYPAIPLFVAADKINASGLAPCEENLLKGFAGFIMEKYGQKILTEKGAIENENNIVSCGVQ